MDYQTIYEYSFGMSKLYNIIPLLFLSLASLVSLIFIKKHFKTYSFNRQLILLFIYLIGGITLIMTIVMALNFPNIYKYEKQLKEIITTQKYLVIEGEVENYKTRETNGQVFESFTMEGVIFEYSDFIEIDGFHQTANNYGPISSNGQHFKISYITKEGRNVILKIEVKKGDPDSQSH